MPSSPVRLIAATALLPSLVAAFSWKISTVPRQCSNLTIAVSGGSPPYNVLVLPFGTSPLGGIEARKILNQNFTGNLNSLSFLLPYPTNSQFVTVLSDSTGFASGGTSAIGVVLSSDDSSCYDATQNVSPDFFINLVPQNQIVTCNASRIWWDPSQVQGDVSTFGVIPGGQSFTIPVQNTNQIVGEGTGFNWIPNVAPGTTLLLGGGDSRGLGSGGSIQVTVTAGINPSTSCLNSTSPSSTPGSPAGGSYPTSTSGSTTDGGNVNGTGGSNTGAIVGGVIGGVVGVLALLLLLWFFNRRRKFHKKQVEAKERPDLFNENEDPTDTATVISSAPGEAERLRVEPFIVPTEPSLAGGTENAGGTAYRLSTIDRQSSEFGRPASMVSTSIPGTPSLVPPGDASTAASSSRQPLRKGGFPPPVLRPVNVIQHDDAGSAMATEDADGEAETVELPPAYTNIRRDAP